MSQEVALLQQHSDLELRGDHHESEEAELRKSLHQEDGVEDQQEPGTDEIVDEHVHDSDDARSHDHAPETLIKSTPQSNL